MPVSKKQKEKEKLTGGLLAELRTTGDFDASVFGKIGKESGLKDEKGIDKSERNVKMDKQAVDFDFMAELEDM